MKEIIRSIKRIIRFIIPNSVWLLRNYRDFKQDCLKQFDLKKIRIFKIYDWHAGFIYFVGEKERKKIFIKLCIADYDTILAEAEMQKYNVEWCPRVVASMHGKYKMIATEFMDLQKKIETISDDEIDDIVNQAVKILTDMRQIKMFHRDIRPENIMIIKGNKLIVFDFGWAIFEERLHFGDDFIEKILNIQYRRNDKEFDDAYSMYYSLCEMFPNIPKEKFAPVEEQIGKYVLIEKEIKGD